MKYNLVNHYYDHNRQRFGHSGCLQLSPFEKSSKLLSRLTGCFR